MQPANQRSIKKKCRDIDEVEKAGDGLWSKFRTRSVEPNEGNICRAANLAIIIAAAAAAAAPWCNPRGEL